jgi:hypothetical protein
MIQMGSQAISSHKGVTNDFKREYNMSLNSIDEFMKQA